MCFVRKPIVTPEPAVFDKLKYHHYPRDHAKSPHSRSHIQAVAPIARIPKPPRLANDFDKYKSISELNNNNTVNTKTVEYDTERVIKSNLSHEEPIQEQEIQRSSSVIKFYLTEKGKLERVPRNVGDSTIKSALKSMPILLRSEQDIPATKHDKNLKEKDVIQNSNMYDKDLRLKKQDIKINHAQSDLQPMKPQLSPEARHAFQNEDHRINQVYPEVQLRQSSSHGINHLDSEEKDRETHGINQVYPEVKLVQSSHRINQLDPEEKDRERHGINQVYPEVKLVQKSSHRINQLDPEGKDREKHGISHVYPEMKLAQSSSHRINQLNPQDREQYRINLYPEEKLIHDKDYRMNRLYPEVKLAHTPVVHPVPISNYHLQNSSVPMVSPERPNVPGSAQMEIGGSGVDENSVGDMGQSKKELEVVVSSVPVIFDGSRKDVDVDTINKIGEQLPAVPPTSTIKPVLEVPKAPSTKKPHHLRAKRKLSTSGSKPFTVLNIPTYRGSSSTIRLPKRPKLSKIDLAILRRKAKRQKKLANIYERNSILNGTTTKTGELNSVQVLNRIEDDLSSSESSSDSDCAGSKVDLWIKSGPPLKSELSEGKLDFLGLFELTTHYARNSLEVQRLEEKHWYAPLAIEVDETETHTSPLNLPVPLKSPSVLNMAPDYKIKSSFLHILGLRKVPPKVRREMEHTWLRIVNDRVKRRCESSLTEYTLKSHDQTQPINSIDSNSPTNNTQPLSMSELDSESTKNDDLVLDTSDNQALANSGLKLDKHLNMGTDYHGYVGSMNNKLEKDSTIFKIPLVHQFGPHSRNSISKRDHTTYVHRANIVNVPEYRPTFKPSPLVAKVDSDDMKVIEEDRSSEEEERNKDGRLKWKGMVEVMESYQRFDKERTTEINQLKRHKGTVKELLNIKQSELRTLEHKQKELLARQLANEQQSRTVRQTIDRLMNIVNKLR